VNLAIEIADGVVRAVVSGAFSYEGARAAFEEILDHARDHGCTRVLIDARRIEGHLSTEARFDLGALMAQLRGPGIRIALVGTEKQVWPDRFLETVAVNRGANARVSTNVEEAMAWLDPDGSRTGT